MYLLMMKKDLVNTKNITVFTMIPIKWIKGHIGLGLHTSLVSVSGSLGIY